MVRGVVLLGCALLLAACSDGGTGGAERGGGGSGARSVLEGMNSDRLCELLPAATAEQTLGVSVDGTEGEDLGVVSRSCEYRLESDDVDESFSTQVETDRGRNVEELLDFAFTDLADETIAPYERVDGLGDGAGYGVVPFDMGQPAKLVVVFAAGDERLVFDVAASPPAPLETLRPLATELLAGLRAELA